MKNIQSFKVSNMSCNHCVANITKALNLQAEVENIEIDLKKKKVDVTGDITAQEVIDCLEEAGYEAKLF